jgi:hypothetical protein
MLQVVLHLLAALAVTLSDIPAWLSFLLIVAITAGLISLVHYYLTPSENEIRKLIYSSEKGWKLFRGGELIDNPELLPSTVSTRFCLFLHFKTTKGRCYHLMIPRDSLSFDVYRQMRIALKVSTISA